MLESLRETGPTGGDGERNSSLENEIRVGLTVEESLRKDWWSRPTKQRRVPGRG